MTLAEKKMGGDHYFCGMEQSIAVYNIFQIHGIPHYVSIDKNGTIVEQGSHLRPGYDMTIKKNETLLVN